jgi:L-cysteate sulfo-lyase
VAGPQIILKGTDLTGLAGGGNKVRKLELLVAEVLARDCDSLVTIGAPQSNHCRQTAAAAAKTGLRCILILRGDPPADESGNLLLDRLLGAEIQWSRDRTREDLMESVLERERSAGRKPYPIPLGGSNGRVLPHRAASVDVYHWSFRAPDGAGMEKGVVCLTLLHESGD